jgi:hypothetical protein
MTQPHQATASAPRPTSGAVPAMAPRPAQGPASLPAPTSWARVYE